MIKVLQFGEGGFLRTFVDAYFDTLCEEGRQYEVNVVKPITFGSLENFRKQNNKYHIILRGTKNGVPCEDVRKINVISCAIDPFTDFESYISLAKDDSLKIIVSNTTEAGICFSENDSFDGFEEITYPAKLTKFLYERFLCGKAGVYLMPVELIDNNADELLLCVEKYIELWSLPHEFAEWNRTQNFYCNTLVDRIVSGFPRDEETRDHLWTLIGEQDELMSVGEPFGLWAVEDKGDIAKYIPQGMHNIEVVLTKDIGYYKKRKVRVLNGSHTNLVSAGLYEGCVTVADCIEKESTRRFLLDTLSEEIVPFVSDDIEATRSFADSVLDRFKNPYLNHLLTSIALNSISKWRTRDLPSFKDYYSAHGKIAPMLTVGFSYLMKLYSSVRRQDGKYIAPLPTRKIEIIDTVDYLEFFANGGSVRDFMKREDVWGEDLTKYNGFLAQVSANLEKLNSGESLL